MLVTLFFDAKQPVDQVCASDLSEVLHDFLLFLGLVPEEEHPLRLLFLCRLGTEYGFQRVRMVARCPCYGAYRHWGWGEILHLLQLEVQFLRFDGKFGHIRTLTTGMTAYKIRYNLLVQLLPTACFVKDLLKADEEFERGLAHDVQDGVVCVLGCHF